MSAPNELLDRWASLIGPSFNSSAPDAEAFRKYADALIAMRVAEAEQAAVQEVWSEASQMATRRFMERNESADEWREIAHALGARQSDLFDAVMAHKMEFGGPKNEWLDARAQQDPDAAP